MMLKLEIITTDMPPDELLEASNFLKALANLKCALIPVEKNIAIEPLQTESNIEEPKKRKSRKIKPLIEESDIIEEEIEKPIQKDSYTQLTQLVTQLMKDKKITKPEFNDILAEHEVTHLAILKGKPDLAQEILEKMEILFVE